MGFRISQDNANRWSMSCLLSDFPGPSGLGTEASYSSKVKIADKSGRNQPGQHKLNIVGSFTVVPVGFQNQFQLF
jgi:hypothetical protein